MALAMAVVIVVEILFIFLTVFFSGFMTSERGLAFLDTVCILAARPVAHSARVIHGDYVEFRQWCAPFNGLF
jgi:hypothetical protein